jgi:predicted RNase H-like HicB family nuclease
MDTAIENNNIPFTAHLFKEDGTFVAYVPELDISSCGHTEDEAKKNIKIATEEYLKTAQDMGTLEEIMEEAGYKPNTTGWLAPEFVSLDHLIVKI